MTERGLSGRIAETFIDSKLTPIIILTVLLLGAFATIWTPREEEPQIVVPMADVFLPFPGASAKVVEEQLTKPIERAISELKGVEYVYSISRPGMALLIVRFYVGEDLEESLVGLYDRLMSNQDLLPPGAEGFTVKPRDINDVPIVTLTLWSERYDDSALRRMAVSALEEIKKVPQTSGGFIVGGHRREMRVSVNPSALRAHGLTPLDIAEAIQAEHHTLSAGQFSSRNQEFVVDAGKFLKTVADIKQVVVGSRDGRPIYLRQVADVQDTREDSTHYVWHGNDDGEYPAVTIAIAKQKGTNAVDIAAAVIEKMESLKGVLIPADVHVTVTRDYGETANEKANELLFHMLIAIAAVVMFLGLTLGFRPALVVSISIPLVLALTLFSSWFIGYTINRVTLFALIFSIGILVDDAIVVVENIFRHLTMGNKPHQEAAIDAVDEVGNPTILATMTVIAALLPMAFVSGLMGPYMRPIPVNASFAMLYSLLVAFIVIPWFCQICFAKGGRRFVETHQNIEAEEVGGRIERIYRRLLLPLLGHPVRSTVVIGGIALLLAGSLSLFATRTVVMKMLPFDNKSELQLVIDMPEGTTLEETARVTKALSAYVRTIPELETYQAYVGTASPFNFNGLVRHYFLRQGAHEGDIQINLEPKHDRTAQSHDIAKRIRPVVQRIAANLGANVKVLEVPPGPPVQSVLVAEIYGPDYDQQQAVAKQVRQAFTSTEGIVDIDDSIEADQTKFTFTVDRVKAALAGISSEDIVKTLRIALGGMSVGMVHLPDEKEPVEITFRLPLSQRSEIAEFEKIHMRSTNGDMIPLASLVHREQTVQDQSIYHKNQKPVVYVVGDIAGMQESPVYGVIDIGTRLDAITLPDGDPMVQHYAAQPWSEERASIKWDGEWQITYETFRDMGLAFMVAMILIYILIVGQFQSFRTPLIIMAPIPLTLIGILPGHWLTGAHFTATSMIGFIALAGIIVRNSILLVDFIQIKEREGIPLEEAVIQAGAIRTRPILLTAAALMVGAFVIVLDPIFKGLAVALLFGVFASTLLTLIVIPILYYYLDNADVPKSVSV